MEDMPLDGTQLLMFVDDIYEDLELWYPKLRLIEAGAQVTVAGPAAETTYRGKHGYPCKSDAAIADMNAADFQGLIVPGGFMPDKLRRDPKVLSLVRDFAAAKKTSGRHLPRRLDPHLGRCLPGRTRYGLTWNQRRSCQRRRRMARRPGSCRWPVHLQPQARRFARLLPGTGPMAAIVVGTCSTLARANRTRTGLLSARNAKAPYRGDRRSPRYGAP